MTEIEPGLNYVIINTESGTSQTLDLTKFEHLIRQKINQHCIEAKILFCSAGKLEETIKQAIIHKPTSIIVGGGDGTINLSAGLLQNTGIALGILPMGTFNLAARDHGIDTDPEIAIEQLCKASIATAPLLRINTFPCMCTATIGYYPRLVKLMNKIKPSRWWLRSIQIIWSTIFYFTRCPAYHFSVETGEQLNTFKSRMIIIVPGSYKDTAGLIPQRNTRLADSISLYIFKHLGRLALLRSLTYMIFGQINKNPDMQIINSVDAKLSFKTKRLIKVMIDGEVISLPNPLHIELKPNSLKLLVVAQSQPV